MCYYSVGGVGILLFITVYIPIHTHVIVTDEAGNSSNQVYIYYSSTVQQSSRKSVSKPGMMNKEQTAATCRTAGPVAVTCMQVLTWLCLSLDLQMLIVMATWIIMEQDLLKVCIVCLHISVCVCVCVYTNV